MLCDCTHEDSALHHSVTLLVFLFFILHSFILLCVLSMEEIQVLNSNIIQSLRKKKSKTSILRVKNV